MDSYIKLKGDRLIIAILIEKYLKDNIDLYRKSNDKVKKGIEMFIQPQLFYVLGFSYKKYSGFISQRYKDDLIENPSTKPSYNHSEPRLQVCKKLFENYDKYDWTGDGIAIEKEVNTFRFDIYTQSENKGRYKEENITRIPMPLETVQKMKRYQTYWDKGWFRSGKLTFEEIQKIPLNKKFKNETELMDFIITS